MIAVMDWVLWIDILQKDQRNDTRFLVDRILEACRWIRAVAVVRLCEMIAILWVIAETMDVMDINWVAALLLGVLEGDWRADLSRERITFNDYSGRRRPFSGS